MSAVSAELDEEEQQYQAALGMATWLGELDIMDEDKAKESIGILCAAARELDITSLDQVQALGFEEALERGGTALGSIMDVFKVYGLDLEGVFESAEIEAVIDGTAAKVPVTIQMFGEDYEFMHALQLVDGKWYADTGAIRCRSPAAAPRRPRGLRRGLRDPGPRRRRQLRPSGVLERGATRRRPRPGR